MPFIPNRHLAIVDKTKLTEYLLSPSHPAGWSKAAFLHRFGFDLSNSKRLEESLLRHISNADNAMAMETKFGTKYMIEAGLETPDGRHPQIRSVWFIETGHEVPKLVTIVPLSRGGA